MTAGLGVVDGRYELRREVAQGGMARIFEAEHRHTKARVAVKLLRPELLGDGMARARLEREGRALALSVHRHVVTLHDGGVCAEHGPYLVLEMLDGRSLDSLITARRRLTIGESVAVARQVCSALSAVHRSGTVHRDVKPCNLVVVPGNDGEGNRVVLLDFGIAQLAPALADAKLTAPGTLLGTLAYMAPEQLAGTRSVDARADVWSCAALFFECATGTAPRPELENSLVQALATPSTSVFELTVLRQLDEVLQRALALQPGERTLTVSELGDGLERALGHAVPKLSLLSLPDRDGSAPAPGVDSSEAPTVDEGVRARRRFARVPYSAPVRIVYADGQVDGQVEDLSEGGLLVHAPNPFPRSVTVEIRLPLPTTGKVAILPAVARWSESRVGTATIGLEFSALPDPVRAEIRGYAELMRRLRRRA